MKHTKSLLIILCIVTVVASMVFSLTVSAASGYENTYAGQETTIDEYLNMKKILSHGFEDGTTGGMFGSIANSGTISNPGGIISANNVWSPALPVYGSSETTAHSFYTINFYNNAYNKNLGRYEDLYIQPKLADHPDTASIEKTPIYGFIAEFDIAFLSPVEVNQERYVHETLGAAWIDPNDVIIYLAADNTYSDESGKKVYVDANGFYVYETSGTYIDIKERTLYIRTDDNTVLYKNEAGNYYNESGSRVNIAEGQARIATAADLTVLTPDVAGENVKEYRVDIMEPLLDENGNEVKDALGETVMVQSVTKKPYEGLTANFLVAMLNTQTSKDGEVRLIYFDAKTENIKIYNCESNKVVYTFPADEWIHIAIQYDADTLLTYVYVGRDGDKDENGNVVGRKLITTMNAIDAPENTGYRETLVYPLQFRLGCQSQAGVVGFDNFLAYQGTSIHNPDLVSALAPTDQFVYLASVLENADGSNTALNSYQSFEVIKESHVNNYYDSASGTVKSDYLGNADVENAISIYLKYLNDVDGIMTALRQAMYLENTNKYIYYVNNVLKVERTFDNMLERSSKIVAAQKFLDSVGNSIIKNDDYYRYEAELAAAEEYVRTDTNSKSFIEYMKLFDNSAKYGASLNRLTNHYENAKVYFDAGISSYDLLTHTASYNALKVAYELYVGTEDTPSAEEIIAQNTREYNSQRFIGVVNLMKNTTTGVWSKDGAQMEALWKIALDILLDNYYDPDYEGMDVAFAIFNSANDYFWPEMQNEHIAILSERLAGFNASESFVDKAATCTYVEQYIKANERYIDMENNQLKALVSTNDAYKAQLETVEIDYAKLLAQNTIEFVNVMTRMELYDTYAELKPLYEQATELYYTMNFKSESISEETINLYVSKYENLRSRIMATEADCMVFISSSAKLNSLEDDDALYAMLSQCHACLANLDETYAGVTEAKAVYDDKYTEFVNGANTVNSQIEQTANIICSLRGNWSFDGIVSYFKSIFK